MADDNHTPPSSQDTTTDHSQNPGSYTPAFNNLVQLAQQRQQKLDNWDFMKRLSLSDSMVEQMKDKAGTVAEDGEVMFLKGTIFQDFNQWARNRRGAAGVAQAGSQENGDNQNKKEQHNKDNKSASLGLEEEPRPITTAQALSRTANAKFIKGFDVSKVEPERILRLVSFQEYPDPRTRPLLLECMDLPGLGWCMYHLHHISRIQPPKRSTIFLSRMLSEIEVDIP